MATDKPMTTRTLLAFMRREQAALMKRAEHVATVIAGYQNELERVRTEYLKAKDQLTEELLHPDDDEKYEVPEGASEAQEEKLSLRYQAAVEAYDEMTGELEEVRFPAEEDVSVEEWNDNQIAPLHALSQTIETWAETLDAFAAVQRYQRKR